jgi:hypothetical protein
MPLPVIPGVVRAAVVGKCVSGQPWVNVWHFQYAGGASSPGPTEIDTLHLSFIRMYSGTAYSGGAAWLSACATATTLDRVDYTVLNGTALGYTKSVAVSGTRAQPSLPSEDAHVVTFRTLIRGRRYRGRTYLPACCSDASQMGTNGELLTTVPALVIAQWTGMAAALVSAQWKHVVASYGKSLIKDPNDPHDKIETTWAPFCTPVATVTMDTKVDVQRNRK